ncbi:MAG: DUF1844 domain-containing protein [Candidatus Zixiibacteriota bacterium]
MTETAKNVDPHFLQLVVSLQAGAMQHMGKIASPISGKIERNLDIARNTIDMLTMLHSKMEGNLTEDEKYYLDHVLYELRLNYVDEVKKDETKTASDESPKEPQAAAEKGEESETASPDEGFSPDASGD